jgi:S-formylglutathione hydrolase FrmB
MGSQTSVAGHHGGVLRRARTTIVLLAALVVLAAGLATAPRARAETEGARLQLLHVEELSPRLSELQVLSPALERAVRVRVLTPAGFDPAVDHLPVLWLLHGGFGSSADWTDVGDAEALTAGLPMIVVMPDAGTGGWYADWRNATAEGAQRWETFHLVELRRFIERRFHTRTDRSGRAIAGLSMGGFGALSYAARHPDLFGFAASFSGAVDLLHPGVTAIVLASPLAHEGLPGDIFGDPVLQRPRWQAHNPVDLAENLRTVEVQLRTGNGLPGGRHGGGLDVQEIGVSQATATLHERLVALGIPHLYDDYGPGAHSWPYWRDDLAATLPAIVNAFSNQRL